VAWWYTSLRSQRSAKALRDGAREHLWWVALDNPAWMCVPANAQKVYRAVSSEKMPPDAP
jgi:hypothetical protein